MIRCVGKVNIALRTFELIQCCIILKFNLPIRSVILSFTGVLDVPGVCSVLSVPGVPRVVV